MIRKNKKNRPEQFRKEEFHIGDYIADHKKVIMPIILMVCLCITLGVALHAGSNKKSNSGAKDDSASVSGSGSSESVAAVSMEENAHADVSTMITAFYDAQASGDLDSIQSVSQGLTEAALIRFKVAADYIDSFDNIDVYTKPGAESGAYVAYVYYEEKFTGYDAGVPGLTTYYVRSNEDGSLYLYFGEMDEATNDYIAELNLQDDYVDLSNKVSVSFNSMMDADPDLQAFLTNLSEQLTEEVGKELADAGISSSAEASVDSSAASSASTAASSAASSSSTAASSASASAATASSASSAKTGSATKIEATDVVNIRSSDSTTADVLGKTEVGKQYTLVEELGNGWSKIKYDGADDGVGYVRSEYFTAVSSDGSAKSTSGSSKSSSASSSSKSSSTASSSKSSSAASSTKAKSSSSAASKKTDDSTTSSAVTSTGTYHVKETVRIRESASTDSDVAAVAYQGEEIEVTNYRADGWCEVNYGGTKGYVKTEFLEK